MTAAATAIRWCPVCERATTKWATCAECGRRLVDQRDQDEDVYLPGWAPPRGHVYSWERGR